MVDASNVPHAGSIFWECVDQINGLAKERPYTRNGGHSVATFEAKISTLSGYSIWRKYQPKVAAWVSKQRAKWAAGEEKFSIRWNGLRLFDMEFALATLRNPAYFLQEIVD